MGRLRFVSFLSWEINFTVPLQDRLLLFVATKTPPGEMVKQSALNLHENTCVPYTDFHTSLTTFSRSDTNWCIFLNTVATKSTFQTPNDVESAVRSKKLMTETNHFLHFFDSADRMIYKHFPCLYCRVLWCNFWQQGYYFIIPGKENPTLSKEKAKKMSKINTNMFSQTL